MQRQRSFFSSNSLALVGGSHEPKLLVSILVVVLLSTETQVGREGYTCKEGYTRGLPPQSRYQKAYHYLIGGDFYLDCNAFDCID